MDSEAHKLINASLVEKWKGVIDMEGEVPLTNFWRRQACAQLIENTIAETKGDRTAPQSLFEDSPTNNFGGGSIQIQDPILITMLRRSMPNLMAYDVAGVQPMKGPTGLIFALRALYTSTSGNEAFYNEPNTAFSSVVAGTNVLGEKHTGTVPGNSTTGTANLAADGLYNFGGAMTTTELESLGSSGNNAFPEMAITIDKISISPGGRALKAQYSTELAHDLQMTHGLDAEKLLSEILSTEITADINRELIRTINVTAKRGAASGTTTVGRFDLDTDSNGRWLGEKLKGLAFFLDLEANQIAKETRRGKGNIIICSSNVASALQMAGVLDYTPALNNEGLAVDDTGNTFAGIAMKRFRVYVDPYTTGNYMTIGYKGTGPMDAGIYYCPYVPLQFSRVVNPDTHQPNIAFKTRYAMAQNPFSQGVVNGAVGSMNALAALTKDSNVYYRRIMVDNIL
jgi:hypothetical protein